MMFFIERTASRYFSQFLRRLSTNPETICANNVKVQNSHLLKSLKVAIIGLPNAGKSTLINQLINRTVCPTSSKVHTTRAKSEAIYVDDNTQLIFIDTPGMVSKKDLKKYQLEESFKKDVDQSLKKADILGVVQDLENPKAWESISSRILPLLKAYGTTKPSILILNKIDRIKKKKILLEIVTKLTGKKGWPHFKDVFMISALENDGVDDLRNYFLDSASDKEWEYQPEIYTNQKPEMIIENMVKAQLMDLLPQEIPYKLSVKLEHFSVKEEGTVNAIVKILCPTERICRVVLGDKGQRIKTISQLCEKDLSNGFRTAVILKLAVEAKEKKPNY